MPFADKPAPTFKKFFVLGTVIQLQVFGSNGERAIKEAVERLYDLDDKMSVFKEDSEISKINKNAGGLPQEVSTDTLFVMQKALEYSNLSNGAFDPTIRPLVSLWGFGTSDKKVPNLKDINEKLKLVNYQDIILDETNRTIKLCHSEQAIDCGGIAKGYAADAVKQVFLTNSITSAIINLGGNVLVLGQKNNETPWNIGIQNPLGPRGEYIGILSAADKSVVTSGNYERYFIRDGKRLHHLIDPKTGYPCENRVISVTVISDNSIDGDALSTCLYVMGLNKGLKLIETVSGVDAIIVTEDKQVYVTPGIRDSFKLSDQEFVYQAGMEWSGKR